MKLRFVYVTFAEKNIIYKLPFVYMMIYMEIHT